MNTRIRIAVVDDHPIVRDGIVAVIGTQNDMQVIQACENADELREASDAIVLDWEIPHMPGAAAIARLHERFADAAIIVFSAYGGDERVRSAFGAGARAYILKGSPAEELLEAIRTCVRGGTVVGRGLAEPFTSGEQPTRRETDVLRLLAQGYTNAQIAQRLSISERTVKFHVTSLFSRLGAKRRTEAIAIARERGLIA